jgi:hypothetical protein
MLALAFDNRIGRQFLRAWDPLAALDHKLREDHFAEAAARGPGVAVAEVDEEV